MRTFQIKRKVGCASRTDKSDFVMNMMKKGRYVAVLLGAALSLSSCVVYDYPMYTSASVGVGGAGWSTSVAWTDARYDVNGFPIFGYSYGQPVYGYTASGAAVFTFAALTASCWVPSWGPAHWYCGHWHYPRHIHRVSCPPKYPSWHRPGHAPAHRPAVHHKPAPGHRPEVNHKPGAAHRPEVNHKPGAAHRPAVNHKPGAAHRPVVNHKLGAAHRPAVNHKPGAAHRPEVNHKPGAALRPAMKHQSAAAQRPAMNHRSVSVHRPAGGMSRPQMSHAPRSAAPRPSGGGGRPGGAHGHRR